MAKYLIRGGNKISGEFTPQGAKNAALPILAASVLTGGKNEFYRCPDISDIDVMLEILESLGCIIERENDRLMIDSSGINCCQVSNDMMRKMRSTVFLAGALLARCGMAVISQPGGCSIGARPIDIHIKALKKLGVQIMESPQCVTLVASRLRGANITLDFPSVGATENVMMTALRAKGITVIHNAAREPEIVDLQNYLVSCGARISGAGTSRITVEGECILHGCCHEIMSDRIEAGTFLMAAACTGGRIRINNFDPVWLRMCCRFLRYSGCRVCKTAESILLEGPERLYPAGRVSTGPYPGFPTDLQPQFTAIMTIASGETRMEETIFESRYGFTKELIKMGADIEIFRRIAIIKGNEFLCGNCVKAADLRGGAALVLAGLSARGETVVECIEHIERGYSCFHRKLGELGVEIDRCI